MIDSGIVTSGTSVERKDPRERKMTTMTINEAWARVRMTSLIEAWINSVES